MTQRQKHKKTNRKIGTETQRHKDKKEEEKIQNLKKEKNTKTEIIISHKSRLHQINLNQIAHETLNREIFNHNN